MKIVETLAQCSHCAHQFRPRVVSFEDTRSFETATIEGNTEPCPKCRQSTLIDKAHMAYRLENGSIGGRGSHFKA